MRRVPARVTLLALAVALLITPAVMAQATPPASPPQAGTPVPAKFRTLAVGSLEVLTPGTGTVGLGRIALAPGESLLFDPNDPSADLVYIASGALTFRVEAAMTMARGDRRSTPAATEPESVAANTEFTLRAGDSALFPPAIAGEVRNDSDDAATAWVVIVALLSEAASTPTP